MAALFFDHLLAELCSYQPSDAIAKEDVGYAPTSWLRLAGSRIGASVAARLTETFPPFADSKEAVKCVCKDFWFYCFRQQASRLQANKKGVFVIHDTIFPPLNTLSKCCNVPRSPVPPSATVGPLAHPHLVTNATTGYGDGSPGSNSADNPLNGQISDSPVHRRALRQLELTCGMIEGFLLSLGFECTVEATIGGSLPACAFQVTLKQFTSSVLDPGRLLTAVSAAETASS